MNASPSFQRIARVCFGLALALLCVLPHRARAAGEIATLGADANADIYGLAMFPDGRLLVSGDFTTIRGFPASRIARLTTEAFPDSTFVASANESVRSLVIQPDGQIVIAGLFTQINGTTRNRVARLNADGTLDAGFNPNTNGVTQAALQPDGKVILTGFFTTLQPNGAPSPTTRNYLARVNADGTLDPSFNPNPNDVVYHVTILPGGQILVAGAFTALQPNGAPSPTTRRGVARLNADGTLDPTFADPNFNTSAHCLAVQTDGKIVASGFFTSVGGQTRNRLARLNADGTLDPSFNPNANARVDSIALQGDGKMIVGGDFTTMGGNPRVRLARLRADGTVDTAFEASPNAIVLGNLLQREGYMITAGQFTQVTTPFNGPVARGRFARLFVENGNRDLEVDTGRVRWTDYGTGPATESVVFEFSSDGGANYTPLGPATRYSGGWELTGLALPPGSGTVRATARIRSGHLNGCSFPDVFGFTYTDLPVALPRVSGNGVDIASGDLTPSATDGTDLGYSTKNGAFITRTFTLRNDGAGPLYPGNVSVNPTGQFFITAQPASSVAPGAGTTFQVSFQPDSGGLKSATLSFATNVLGQTPYTFGIQATCAVIDPVFNPIVGAGSIECLAIRHDTRILLGGTFSGGLIQLLPGGAQDNFTPNARNKVQAYGVQTYGDYRVLAIGNHLTNPPEAANNRFARFLSNGLRDLSFPSNLPAGGRGCLLQPDGAIVLHGLFTQINGSNRAYLGRVFADGTTDSSFTALLPGPPDVVVLQRDGRLLVGGPFSAIGSLPVNAFARLEADGAIDPTFRGATNVGGRVYTAFVLPDHRILVGGHFTQIGGQPRSFIARLLPDGSADPTFTASADGEVRVIVPQADGRILVGGLFNTISGAFRQFLARLMPDGSIDTSFVPLSGGPITAMALENSGSIMIAGAFTVIDNTSRNGFVRYANYPATQSLSVVPNRITWLRGGAAPEATRVEFSYSSDGGANYTPLAAGQPIPGGWELSGLNLPASGRIRAQGYIGLKGEGLQESAVNYTLPAPQLAVSGTAPIYNGALTAKFSDGSNFGTTTFPGGVVMRSFTVTAQGAAPLTVGNVTVSGPHAAAFTITAQPAASVPAGQSTTFDVRFSPTLRGLHHASLSFTHDANVGTPFVFAVSGFGGNLDLDFAAALPANAEVCAATPDLYLGGFFTDLGGSPRSRLARLNPAGAVTSFDPGTNGVVYALTVQPDGRVVASGSFSQMAGVGRPNFGRVLPSGADDPTFTPSVPNGAVLAVLPLQDGRMLVAGTFNGIGPAGRLLARLSPAGIVDGYAPLNLTTFNIIYCLAHQTDRSVLVAGQFQGTGNLRNLVRILEDGPMDNTFAPNPDGPVLCAVQQPDGKILLGGLFQNVGGVPRLNLARVHANGALDTTFVAHANRAVSSLALQTDGKILVTGEFTSIGAAIPTTPRLRLARLLPDGSVDPDFDPGANAAVQATLLADGSIFYNGAFTQLGGAVRGGLARHLNDAGSESLTSPTPTSLQWLRSGSLPEAPSVTFEVSTDKVNWNFLGYGTRIAGGWQWSSLTPLPRYGFVRARAWYGMALHNASIGFVESPLTVNRLNALENWRQQNFGDYANTGPAADSADPDFDGLANLLEFAFGQNPNAASSAALPPLQRNATNVFYSFPTPPSVSGVTYGAEWTTDLTGTWTPIPDTGGGGGQHLFTLPVGTNQQVFVRLRVSVP